MSERGTSYEGQRPALSGGGSRERRVALVIGNSAYAHAEQLRNPVNDAEAMAGVLAALGFDVVKGIDVDLRGIGDLQAVFEDKLRGRPDVALLFYAGHGLQVAGRNYLVPVDAEITQRAHLASRALLFNDLLDDMAAQAQASLIFLDACRDNPFTRNLARALGDTARYAGVRGGLARIEKVAGTFIAYATAPDTVAYDGTGENSPFTAALLEHIETPGLSVGDLMIDVRNKVLAETNERQEPWDQSSLRARFYFVPEVEDTPPPQAPEVSGAAQEWAAIQNTDSLAVLAAFQERHPDPPWSTYAEARAEELRAADEARRKTEERERQEAEARARHEEEEANRPKPPRWEEAPTGEPGTTGTGGGRGGKPPGWVWAAGAGAIALVSAVSVFYQGDLPPKPGPGNGTTAVTEETGSEAESPATAEAEREPAPAPEQRPAEQASEAGAAEAVEVNLASGGTKRIKPGSGESFKDCADCPEMVVVPAGRFMMGSPESERSRDNNEGPRHEVIIPEPFAVGKFEVTFAEWDACVASGGCTHKPEAEWGRGRQPVIRVSWADITTQYLPWLNRKVSGLPDIPYRLLSEAEWEYVARAQTESRFFFGASDAMLAKYAIFYGNSSGKSWPVGSKKPNPWGIFDVYGNVYEWVEDCWNENYAQKPKARSVDGSPWISGKCESRVIRSGSWESKDYSGFDTPRRLRSASRNGAKLTLRTGDLGFRLARTLTP